MASTVSRGGVAIFSSFLSLSREAFKRDCYFSLMMIDIVRKRPSNCLITVDA